MTRSVDVQEAQTHLSRLLDEVAAGQDVVIARAAVDPFDRMLAAQAVVEGAVLITRDPAFGQFPDDIEW